MGFLSGFSKVGFIENYGLSVRIKEGDSKENLLIKLRAYIPLGGGRSIIINHGSQKYYNHTLSWVRVPREREM